MRAVLFCGGDTKKRLVRMEWRALHSSRYPCFEQPPISIHAELATFTNVPGRSGSLTTLQGEDVYDDMVMTATCFLQDATRIAEIPAWLKGRETVTFAKRPGGHLGSTLMNDHIAGEFPVLKPGANAIS